MADEPAKTIAPPETVPTPPPSWTGSASDLVKLLMQGQGTQQPVATDVAVQANPWLKALEQATANPSMLPSMPISQPQTPAPKVQELAVQGKKHETPPLTLPKAVGVPQLPVSAIMQMQQHQVSPAVEAARQRVVQSLLQQRPHGVMPQPPVAKG